MMRKFLILLLGSLFLLSGCQTAAENGDTNTDAASATDPEEVKVIDVASLFSERDLSSDYDESAAVSIELAGDSISCDSDAVSIDGSCVTLLDEGTYLISGTLDDGQILVDAEDTDKVQIVLSGADITSTDSAAIYSLNADKVFVTLEDGTDNTLTNGGTYAAIDENNIDGVIFSKTDLTLNGSGSLSINAQAGHGVVSKDELTITDGSYSVTAAEHGLVGKDSLALLEAHSKSQQKRTAFTPKMQMIHPDGTYTINAQGDAISASGALLVDSSNFELTTGEGSASVTMPTEDEFAPGGRGGPSGDRPPKGRPNSEEEPAQQSGDPADTQTTEAPAQPVEKNQESETTSTETTAATDSISQKGMKANGMLVVNGGVFTVDSADDCIHSGGALTVTNGTFTLSSGDDAIHSDDAVTIQSGEFSIPYCYEGVEGLAVTVEGVTFDVTAHDDGFNAAGGADSSGFGGRGDQFSVSEDSFITVNGGTITIVSDGDCLDSNGDLTINGGTLDLTCNGSGNTTLDCNGTYTNDGGDVTTNDGAESNPGGMGGGRPGGKQAPPAQETPSA